MGSRSSWGRAPHAAAVAAAAALALAGGGLGVLAGCGGGDDDGRTDPGAAAVAARQIPQGITITHTETGENHPVGTLMPRLHTAHAAQLECGYFRSGLIANLYGGIPGDYASIALHFSLRRAAPGAADVVRRGCRDGLRD
jgi:hypothetical protein